MSEKPWIDCPGDYVDSLLANFGGNGEPNDLLKFFTDSFKHRLLRNDDIKLQLISDNVSFSRPELTNKLCVLRGMVQDFRESELFVLDYSLVPEGSDGISRRSTAFLRDNTVIPEGVHMDQGSVKYADRLSINVVPVPGENEWVVECLKSNFKVVESELNMDYDKSPKMRKCVENTSDAASQVEVKFYEDESDIAINSVYHFYGVFENRHIDNQNNDMQQCGNEDPMDESGSLPRVIFHAIFAKPVFSAVVEDVFAITSDEKIEASCQVVSGTRPELIGALSRVFRGDAIAAEWTLLHLISSVYKRADLMPIGNLSLNIINCSHQTVQELVFFLRSIVPSLVLFTMTVDSLNNSRLIPQKDVDSGKLHSGLLQLPPGASLVIDETRMEPGQLNEQGMRNLTALTTLVQSQKVLYDYKFQTVEIMTNYNVLVLSSTKSLIKSPGVTWKLTPNVDLSVTCDPGTLKLPGIRESLTVAKFLPYEVPPEMSQVAQKFFVEERQQNKTYTTDEFHHLLNVARLVSLSFGCTKLSPDCWEKALRITSLGSESRESN